MFGLFRRPSADPSEFGEFLRARGAFVAQKTVLDYCRVKAGRSEAKLFANPDFQVALEHCRWQVFFAALRDVAVLAEAHLRPRAGNRAAGLASGLAALHCAALAAEAPPGEEARAARDAAREALPRRLAAAQLADPRPPHRMPLEAEPVLFATLPVAEEQRRGEGEAIRGALRMHIVSTQQEMERLFDADPLADRIVRLA